MNDLDSDSEKPTNDDTDTATGPKLDSSSLNQPGAGWANKQSVAGSLCSSPSCNDTNCDAPTALGNTPPSLPFVSPTKGTLRPLADFYHAGNKGLLSELKGHVMISQHDIPQEEVAAWAKSMKEHGAWKEFYGKNGRRVSSGQCDAFPVLVTDQESPICFDTAVNLKKALKDNGGVIEDGWATAYDPDTKKSCPMKKHDDDYVGKRAVITFGDSFTAPSQKPKTITFYKQVRKHPKACYSEESRITFILPHGTLISMNAHGGGSDSKQQRASGLPFFMHQVDNGCGTYALFLQFRRSCTEAKEVDIQELRGIFHSALVPADPKKSKLVHIPPEHFVIPAVEEPNHYSAELQAIHVAINKTCWEEGCAKDRWDTFLRCQEHQQALGCVEVSISEHLET